MVERSIAWLIGVRGRCRRVPYRGVVANNWWIHTRAAALNLRRLLNLGLTADQRHLDPAPRLTPPADRSPNLTPTGWASSLSSTKL